MRDNRNSFQPPLMDRLFDDLPDSPYDDVVMYRYSLSEIKLSVARDLESLLNTRQVLSKNIAGHYPHTARSLLAFGIEDFVGLSLLNPDDRKRICRGLEEAILSHEPRLHKVQVNLETSNESIRELKFRVNAILRVEPIWEPVGFDAMLQPNTQHYVVRY